MIRYHYDAVRGRLDTIIGIGLEKDSTIRFPISYDGAGRRTRLGNNRNSWVESWVYNEDDQPTRHTWYDSLNHNPPNPPYSIADTFLVRDDAGRVTNRHGMEGIRVYTYDPLGQVTQDDPETFVFDGFGAGELKRSNHTQTNMDSTLFETSTGRVLKSWVNKVNGQQWAQLPHFYYYDASGSRLRDSIPYNTLDGYGQINKTSFDGAGRIVAMRQDTIPYGGSAVLRHLWTYWYDAVGRRVLTADSTPTLAKPITRLFYDGDNIALTGDAYWQGNGPDGTPVVLHGLSTEAFLHDGVDHPLYSATNAKGIGCGLAGSNGYLEYFYHADERGSVRRVVWGSGTNCNTSDWSYQGFGAGSAPVDGRPGFAGAPSDGSGLVFMRNRAYDPNTGTFTQPDPIGLAGGINLYGYAGNNPVAYTDPFGLCIWDGCVVEAMAIGMVAFGGVRMVANLVSGKPATEGVAMDMVSGAAGAVSPAPPAGRIAGAIGAAEGAVATGANGSVRVASRAEANIAARIWAGIGGKALRDTHAGQVGSRIIGRMSADETRVARFAAPKPNGTTAANLESKITGSNMHVVVDP